MIITFQSRAAADVTMFCDVARHMMAIAGKEPADKGTITVADLPAAIARLQAAIAADKATRNGRAAAAQAAHQTAPDDRTETIVSVSQRALPLVELFQLSLKQEVPVVWGV